MTSPGQCLLRYLGETPLHDRVARRRAVAAAAQLISSFDDTQLAAADVTAALLRYHDDARAANGGVCRLGRYHQLLHVSTVIAFRWTLSDTALVCRLLRAIADCEATLERLLAGAIFGTRVTFLISGAKSDLDDECECLRAAEFFLGHATAGDLQLAVNYDAARRRGWERTFRAVDLPLLSYGAVPALHAAVGARQPAAVLLLLRFGARLDFVPVAAGGGGDALRRPVAHLCDALNEETAGHVAHGRPYSEPALLCLRLLLRAAPPRPLRLRPAGEPVGRPDGADGEGPALHYTVLAQEPRLRRFAGVPELRQLARCATRRRLAQLGRLPAGVCRLPLPESLRQYVDLAED